MAKVLVPLAPGFEELEAVTIIDLLRRANITVVTAGTREGPITASRGTVLVPDTTLEAVWRDPFDMVVLPGGLPGSTNLDADPRVRALLARLSGEGRYVAAICAAPLVLANAGLLAGREATAYPGVLEKMALPNVTLVAEPVVRDGGIITSRGPGTAMDFALELIEALMGQDVRYTVEKGLQRPARGH